MSARRTLLHGVITILAIWGSAAATAAQAVAPAPQIAVPTKPQAVAPTSPGAAPAATGAVFVPSGFTVGPEDVLTVLFWRDQDMSGDVTVRPDGMITLPLLGDVKAAGLLPEVLGDQIQQAAAKYLTDANVTVVVKQINSRKVFITGLVTKPGTYPLTAPRTVLQLIALAGGVLDFADAEHISVLREDRAGRTRAYEFNYKDVSKGKRLEQNMQLLPGDTVVVP